MADTPNPRKLRPSIRSSEARRGPRRARERTGEQGHRRRRDLRARQGRAAREDPIQRRRMTFSDTSCLPRRSGLRQSSQGQLIVHYNEAASIELRI
jgi:hypothetical protein